MATISTRFIFATTNATDGFALYYTENGTSYDLLASGGLGTPRQAYGWSFAEFGNRLFFGTYNQGTLFSPFNDGAGLYRSRDGLNYFELSGDQGFWSDEGFGNDQNYGIPSMAVYRDRLYLGTAQCYFCLNRQGLEIWEVRDANCGLSH